MFPTRRMLLLDLPLLQLSFHYKTVQQPCILPPIVHSVHFSLLLFNFPTLCLTLDTISHTRPPLCCSEQTHPLLVFEADVTVDCVYKPGGPNLCTFTTGYHLRGQEHSLSQQDQSMGLRSKSSWDTQTDTEERLGERECVWTDWDKRLPLAIITLVSL